MGVLYGLRKEVKCVEAEVRELRAQMRHLTHLLVFLWVIIIFVVGLWLKIQENH
jgi:hypothetical protein